MLATAHRQTIQSNLLCSLSSVSFSWRESIHFIPPFIQTRCRRRVRRCERRRWSKHLFQSEEEGLCFLWIVASSRHGDFLVGGGVDDVRTSWGRRWGTAMVWGGRWWIGKVCGAVLELGGGDGRWSCGGGKINLVASLPCFLWSPQPLWAKESVW